MSSQLLFKEFIYKVEYVQTYLHRRDNNLLSALTLKKNIPDTTNLTGSHGPSVCGLHTGQTPVCRVHSDFFFINLMSERRGSVSTQQTGTILIPLSSMNDVFISMNNKNGAKY